MISRKLKTFAGSLTAITMCLTAMLPASAIMSFPTEETIMTDSVINSVFDHYSETADLIAFCDNIDPEKTYFDMDASFVYGEDHAISNSSPMPIVSDTVFFTDFLGFSLGFDYEIDTVNKKYIVNDVYAVFNEVGNQINSNIICVPNEIYLSGLSVKDLLEKEDVLATVFDGFDYELTNDVTSKTTLDVTKIVFDADFLESVSKYEYDYLFIRDSVEQVINPAFSSCPVMSTQVFSGGIYIDDANKNLGSLNGDIIYDKNENWAVYHNYPHAYDNENFKNGVLTVNDIENIYTMSFANTDWTGVNEIVFGKNVERIGSIFLDNDDIPATITIMNEKCTVNMAHEAERIKLIKGYAGSEAEAFADKYGIKFEVLSDDSDTTEPITTTVTTTAPVVTTTTATITTTTTVSNEPDDIIGNVDKPVVTTTVTNDGDNFTTTTTSVTTGDENNTVTTVVTDDNGDITTPAEPVKGDANSDGKVDVRDAAHIARAAAKSELTSLPVYADHNGDDKVDVRDAASIARYCAMKAPVSE